MGAPPISGYWSLDIFGFFSTMHCFMTKYVAVASDAAMLQRQTVTPNM
jgi:hypothetical protein